MITKRYLMWRKVTTRCEGPSFQCIWTVTVAWVLFGSFQIWSKVLDKEEEPSWSYIARATLGSSEWENRLWKEYGHLIEKGKS